ncbi:MAG: tRNA (5-methylaminomethyl-2-thiouridine)(34)-methyltransferase MnmD [Aurantibacter sp.]
MRRKIITTSDGSKTIRIEDWNEQYHSVHGAVQEAEHVFIEHGLSLFRNRHIEILEMGFGTGLNALITLIRAEKQQLKIHYTGVEAYPVSETELEQLNYISILKAFEFERDFQKMHVCDWEKDASLGKNFILQKRRQSFLDINDKNRFDLIYFDAFGPRVQPELWTEIMFKKMFDALKGQGILVTYSAKGSVRRAMQAVGFKVERLPGPPGKREMLRATKASR